MKKGYNLLILKALEFFIQNPYEEIHLREFSRRLKISVNSSQRFLDLFLHKGFIKEERKANLRYFKANIDNIVFRNIKITYSLDRLEEINLADKLEESKVSHAVLFGSIGEGKDDVNSDLDIVIIGINKNKVLDLIKEIEHKMHKEVNLHFFSWHEWKRTYKENKAFYLDVISKGINLIGEMPIVE